LISVVAEAQAGYHVSRVQVSFRRRRQGRERAQPLQPLLQHIDPLDAIVATQQQHTLVLLLVVAATCHQYNNYYVAINSTSLCNLKNFKGKIVSCSLHNR